jgi:hypothetical protein
MLPVARKRLISIFFFQGKAWPPLLHKLVRLFFFNFTYIAPAVTNSTLFQAASGDFVH